VVSRIRATLQRMADGVGALPPGGHVRVVATASGPLRQSHPRRHRPRRRADPLRPRCGRCTIWAPTRH